MFFVKRFASFQDTKGQLQKFTHGSANDRHFAQTTFLQPGGEAFDDRGVFQGVDRREIEGFADTRIAGL